MPSRKKEVFGQLNEEQGIMENKMETTIVYWGYIGIMEQKMETTILVYIGVMEKKMETTILGSYRDNGKENGNYYIGVI